MDTTWLTKDAVEKMRPMMRKVAGQNLNNLINNYAEHTDRPVKLNGEFAGLVPPQVVYHVLGVPGKDIPMLLHDSEVRTSTSRDVAQSSNTNFQKYMKELVEQRIKEPKTT